MRETEDVLALVLGIDIPTLLSLVRDIIDDIPILTDFLANMNIFFLRGEFKTFRRFTS